jgi:hypothetical protein
LDKKVTFSLVNTYYREYIEQYDRDEVLGDCMKTTATATLEMAGCNIIEEKLKAFHADYPNRPLSNAWGSDKWIPRDAHSIFLAQNPETECTHYDWERKILSKEPGEMLEPEVGSGSTPSVIVDQDIPGAPCSPKDIDKIYDFLIAEAFPTEIQHIKNCAYEGFSREPFYLVCTAKNNLLNTLQDKGWSCAGDGCPKPGVSWERPSS